MKRFKNILVAVDTRYKEHPSLQWAIALAEQNQAKLTLVESVPEFSWLVRATTPNHERIRDAYVKEKAESLEVLATPIRQQGIEIATKVLLGKTSNQIINEVNSGGHDLVVHVTKGIHSRKSGFFGTTSKQLLRKCPCPVWLVKSGGAPRFTQVLAAVEPIPHDDQHAQLNNTILELATSIAKYDQGHCHIVHAWEIYGASILKSHMQPEEFDDMKQQAAAKTTVALDELLATYGMSCRDDTVHLLEGEPHLLIPKLVAEKNVDLLVMGTIARSGVSGMLMGNTAEKILEQVQCPVLAIKPPGFVSSAND